MTVRLIAVDPTLASIPLDHIVLLINELKTPLQITDKGGNAFPYTSTPQRLEEPTFPR